MCLACSNCYCNRLFYNRYFDFTMPLFVVTSCNSEYNILRIHLASREKRKEKRKEEDEKNENVHNNMTICLFRAVTLCILEAFIKLCTFSAYEMSASAFHFMVLTCACI